MAPAWWRLGLILALSSPHLISGKDTDLSGCNFTAGIDYDTTVGTTHNDVATQDDCCALCSAAWKSIACRAGVYSPSDRKCYLKGGLIQPKHKSGVTSCAPNGLPPAPTPAPEFDCSAPGANCAVRLAATHWNPCYFINSSLPSLLDGAAQVSTSLLERTDTDVC